MVDAITAISASATTSPTQVDRSFSITSEPDNKWVAARQSQINADQVAQKRAGSGDHGDKFHLRSEDEEALAELGGDHSRERADGGASDNDAAGEPQDAATLSGESGLIGTVNFDDDTPFGHRVAII